jgi:hypothetical protein
VLTTLFHGWQLELVAEISAAPSRHVAAALVRCSASAIGTLPDGQRELLLAALQDVIAELPEQPVSRAARKRARRHSAHGGRP